MGFGPSSAYQASATLTGGSGGVSSGRTYSSVSLGAEAANRTIIVANGFRSAIGHSVASMTIGGVSATKVAQQVSTATFSTIVSFWAASVATGTTGTIVTTYSDSTDCAEALGVYAAYGLNSSSPLSVCGSNNATVPQMGVNVAPSGLVIGAAWALGQSSPMAWYGLQSDYGILSDPTSSSQYQFGASALNSADISAVLNVNGVYAASSSYEPAALIASFH